MCLLCKHGIIVGATLRGRPLCFYCNSVGIVGAIHESPEWLSPISPRLRGSGGIRFSAEKPRRLRRPFRSSPRAAFRIPPFLNTKKRIGRLWCPIRFWRKRWDSNPRALACYLISSQGRYDLFDTLPYSAPFAEQETLYHRKHVLSIICFEILTRRYFSSKSSISDKMRFDISMPRRER